MEGSLFIRIWNFASAISTIVCGNEVHRMAPVAEDLSAIIGNCCHASGQGRARLVVLG
jgi:hypothetical protein